MAVAAGADYLGVVLVGGPRLVEPALVREIVAAAGKVPVLAVMRPAPAGRLLEFAAATGVAGVQLHGEPVPGLAAELRTAELTVWQSLALAGTAGLEAGLALAMQATDAVLVEPRVAGRAGGLGVALGRDLALQARQILPRGMMVLAGGLDDRTVAAAIGRIGPDVVDVSSGVESSPGHKDRNKVSRFLEAVREASSPG